MKTRILIYGLLVFSGFDAYSQNNGYSPGFWKFTSLDGEVKLKGLYRQKYTTLNDFSESQESMYFSGGLSLNTKSYIWHPSFLQIDLGGEFYPESNQDDYLVTPDRAEVRTLKGLDIGTTLFKSKPVTLNSWVSWNDSYSNRENLTNIRTKTTRWGSSLFARNRILPVTVSYNNNQWDQEETESGRTYQTEQSNFDVSTQKSFTQRDRNELNYSHNHYFRSDYNLSEIENITDNVRLNNSYFFDNEKRYAFRSMIYYYNRYGNQNYMIFNATENLTFNLPQNLRFTGIYNFYNQQQESQKSRQNKINVNLGHKLFSSLNSQVFYEYSGINHTNYRETRNSTGLNLRYTKKIPTGQLNLTYYYSLLRDVMDTDPGHLQIFDEEHLLSDGEISTLGKLYVDWNTVLVKDVTGTIIYHIDFDYILIEQGDYTEIQRVPGGQIPNMSTVYIDYVTVQTGSYKYDAHSNNVSANITLFNRFLELYYRGQFMNYKNVEKSDLLVLNYIKRNTYGGKLYYRNAELGVEYEYQNSTITPFKLMRYYLNFQKRFNKIILSLNGNFRDYDMLDEEINRKYSDLSGKAAYEFRPGTKLDLLLGYRHQAGPGIDLDLLTASTEFKTAYRKLYLTLGLSLYLRDYLEDITNYYSAYFEIVRRF
ncbi:MAG: hypothetical protein ABFS32_18235 [Bacteroidota bacterium]